MDHGDRGFGRLNAFVSLVAAAARFGLLQRLRRQHAEDHGNAGARVNLR